MRLKLWFFTAFWICLLAGPAQAGNLTLGCAANFTGPMKRLVDMYREQTGTEVVCTFGSTGMLYGQIKNGAPYDLFFAADEKRPALLHEADLALAPVRYATGRVVLWSASGALRYLESWKAVVGSPSVVRVGIANPDTAPYGLRAREAMEAARVWKATEPKLAYGKSVGVAFQYGYSKATDASFVALSQALSDKGAAGRYWPVPEAGPVYQDACVLASGDQDQARNFLAWMAGPEPRTIIEEYGYE